MDLINLPPRSTPYYSKYRRDCFIGGTGGETAEHGDPHSPNEQLPPFNTDPAELEKLAKEKLTEKGWSYVYSNAGLSLTQRANREAFYNYRIVPRMLTETTKRDTSTEIFGYKIAAPIAAAPIGINKIYHQQGELPVAQVFGELNLPYSLSTAGSQPIEDVGAANDKGYEFYKQHVVKNNKQAIDNGHGVRFFQLYAPHDDELLDSLLTRAYNSGFTICMMTLDTWQLAWRHLDVNIANYAFYYGIGCDLGFTDPVFQKRLKEKGIDPKKDPKRAGQLWIDSIWHGKSFVWDDIPRIRDKWKKISGGKPFVLKGIQSVEDAVKSVEYKCDGIVVSNHAGRQVDGAMASLDCLPPIVDAVGDKLTVMFDSGVRSAADVFKAVALGAKLVFVGRLYIYGLSIQGHTGVRHVIQSLLSEFDLHLQCSGYASVKDITRKTLKQVVGQRIEDVQ